MNLTEKKCAACDAGTPRLTAADVQGLLPKLAGWSVEDNRKLQRKFRFADFRQAMAFINQMADLAEGEGHHPDFTVHYNVVEVTLWTHVIGGLSENDFILAAKIDQIKRSDWADEDAPGAAGG